MAQEESQTEPVVEGLPPAKALRSIGGYDLFREIGRGGMGIVYEARQRHLDRRVALKLILAGEFASELAVARFREEAGVIASLDHPKIVPVYDVGEAEGWHFYTMKLIEGESLARRLERSGQRPGSDATSGETSDPTQAPGPIDPGPVWPNPREAAALLVKIARAVHFVHERGIIHRDLSPENILIDADGELWVSDFGLARLAPQVRLTRSYTILGKPDHMSPEQADAREQELTVFPASISFTGLAWHALISVGVGWYWQG